MGKPSFSLFGVLLITVLVASCDKKKSECEVIVGSMKSLSRKLAATQKVTSNKGAQLDQVVAALRPFALEAKDTGETLTNLESPFPELKNIAERAGSAASALAESATKMADAAERAKGIDAARRAVSIKKTFVDASEAKVRELCTPATRECAALTKVLFGAPPFPETAGDADRAWLASVDAWALQLSSVRLSNSELQQRTASLVQSWKSFASAMTSFATLSDAATELDTAAKSLNENIGTANAAVGAAVKFCGN